MFKRPKSKHRRSSRLNRAVKRAAIIGTAMAIPAVGMGTVSAEAASVETWNRLAQCESGGNWQINTGNGYSGGLQFASSTWRAFGGGSYSARADLASKAEQITVAERVLGAQGWGAWPACSRKLGLSSADKGGRPGVSAAKPKRSVAAKPKRSSLAGSGRATRSYVRTVKWTTKRADYVVRSGDTLGRIAARYDVDGGWRALYKRNRQVVGANPNMIYPGQRLDVR